eukprot:1177185-Prorocentrum_minimum.AAC.3
MTESLDADPRPVLKARCMLQPKPLDLTLPGFDIDETVASGCDENLEDCGVCWSTGSQGTDPAGTLSSRRGFVGQEGEAEGSRPRGQQACTESEVVSGRCGTYDNLNAIDSNICTKQGTSYYYAHQPRNTEGPSAPAPNPDGIRLRASVAHSTDIATEGPAASVPALKDRSAYYYAHANRNTNEPAAPEPQADGWVLGRVPADLPTPEETIQTFVFSDEEDVVKVYLPLEGVGKKVTKDDVQCTFGPRSLTVIVRG